MNKKIGLALCLIFVIPIAGYLTVNEWKSDSSELDQSDEKTYHSPGYEKQMESEVFVILNQERESRGIHSLERNAILDSVAEAHSQDMAKKDYFNHINLDGQTPMDRVDETGKICKYVGENLAYNSHESFTAQERMEGLMNSPSHRDNILDTDYVQVGLAVEKGEDSFYLTQVFCGLFKET